MLESIGARVPKYVKIADDLRADIRSGALSPNDRLPSYTETAERYKVAKHTVDKAHAILQREGLVRREQGRGVFVEERKDSRTGIIGLLLRGATPSDVCVRGLINGIQRQARLHDMNVMLVDALKPNLKGVDGVLICSNHLEVALIDLPVDYPRVLLLEPAAMLDIANVVADDFQGTRLAVRHLVQLGHRRISFIRCSQADSYGVQRLAGYKAGLQEAGIEFDSALCRLIWTGDHSGSNPGQYFLGERTMKRWLEEGWRELGSTAILAHNDGGAFGVMKALAEYGMSVPEDVSVVGFDAAETAEPEILELTTVQVPFEEVGARGFNLLLEQIERGHHTPQKFVEPVLLKAGKSTRRL